MPGAVPERKAMETRRNYAFGVFGNDISAQDAVNNNMQVLFNSWVIGKLDRVDRVATDNDVISLMRACDKALQDLAITLMSGSYLDLPPQDMAMDEYSRYASDYYLAWEEKADELCDDLDGYEDPESAGSSYSTWVRDLTIQEAAERNGLTIPDLTDLLDGVDEELPFK